MKNRVFIAAILVAAIAGAVFGLPGGKVMAAGETTVKVDTSINPNARVISTPVGIDCADDCAEGFTPGAAVTLTAAPVDGFSIYKWTVTGTNVDSCAESTDTSDKCSFTVPGDGAVSVKATWRYNRTQLKVTTIGAGSGTVSGGFMIICGTGGTQCSYDYPLNPNDSSLTFNAKPDAGSVFAGWDTTGTVCFDSSGSKPAVNTSATCSFVLPAIKKTSTIVARFEPAPQEAATTPVGGPKLSALVVDGDAVSLRKDVKIPYKQKFTVAGTAAPNALINLYVYSEPKKYTVTTDEQGEWNYEVPGLPAGSHRIEAAIVDPATKKEGERVQLLSFAVSPAASQKVTRTEGAKKKGFPWLLVIGIVIIIGAVVGFMLYKRKQKNKVAPPPQTMGPPIGQQPQSDSDGGTPNILPPKQQ